MTDKYPYAKVVPWCILGAIFGISICIGGVLSFMFSDGKFFPGWGLVAYFITFVVSTLVALGFGASAESSIRQETENKE